MDQAKAEERDVLAFLLQHAPTAGRALFVAEIADRLGWPLQQAATVLARLALRDEVTPKGALVADPTRMARVLAGAPQAVSYYLRESTQHRYAAVRADPAGARARVLQALTTCALPPGAQAPRPRSAAWISAELMYSRFPLDAAQVSKILAGLVARGKVVEIDNPRVPHYLPATLARSRELVGVI